MKEELRKFRFRKDNANSALICKHFSIDICIFAMIHRMYFIPNKCCSLLFYLIIVKVDREKQLVCVDELLDEISVDELQEQLPGHQPRYIVYSYKMIHEDNRISYPMCFIFYTPRDSQMELQIMYAGTKRALQREADLTRVYEVRELDELTEDWLKEKLAR